ncbi:hypothetical protein SAMN04487907_106115 [Zunongwangia mangrovi]|uniref:DoxX protein n=1 Tax=Zunongwangia mangrovi TaxID=1334022 RepID=A0A1I1KQJ0_9FLAO|nr:hypothetical protein [Zunongwangia mangrovi]SFC63059.1 hypothetical protein SAMN04487907_106115 [Zunongwangia mangrovi]
MKIIAKLEQFHLQARRNIWIGYFAIFCRIALAAGFLPSGFVKINGERFTALAINHPMGHYLEALFYTGYYYPFIGVMQMLAAVLLLIPRTATLGALFYFPIILNITVLSLAVRFDGSLFTAPLMLTAVIFLLCWDYHKLKYILPLKQHTSEKLFPQHPKIRRFPFAFFGGVFMYSIGFIFFITNIYEIMPRNSVRDCERQCSDTENPENCITFCECIHEEGNSLQECLEVYKGD